jgi:hypothetical protein
LIEWFKNLLKIKDNELSPKEISANQFINIKNIIGNILYTNDGYVFSYIKLMPISIDLLSPTEKKLFINTLTAELSSETKPFQFFAISQSVDINKLIENLNNKKGEISNDNTRKKLIYNEVNQITSFSISGDIIERQFYFIIWEKLSEDSELLLRRRANDLSYKFQTCGIEANILDTQNIYILLNLFSHPYSKERNAKSDTISATIPTLGGKA